MQAPAPRAELNQARAHTDALFALVSDDTLYERPIADRHRLVFYLGHLDAFDWNQVARGALDAPSFHPDFDRLFEAGIDPPPGQAPQDRPSDWPHLDEVRAYVRQVRLRLDELWSRAPLARRHVALEHRWMHAETLCYLLQRLPHALKRAPAGQAAAATPAPPQDFVPVPAGRATLGQHDGQFGWDNEFPLSEVEVPAFEIARHKVTNAQYLRFVLDGATPPPFWVERDGRWWLRRMFDDVPLPAEAPVYATQRQATAYATWAGGALPTADEWEHAARGADGRSFPHGGPLEPGHANIDATYGRVPSAFGPDEVGSFPASDSPYGVADLAGNVWETTITGQDRPSYKGGSFYQTAFAATSENMGNPGDPNLGNIRVGLRICADAARAR